MHGAGSGSSGLPSPGRADEKDARSVQVPDGKDEKVDAVEAKKASKREKQIEYQKRSKEKKRERQQLEEKKVMAIIQQWMGKSDDESVLVTTYAQTRRNTPSKTGTRSGSIQVGNTKVCAARLTASRP